MKIIKLKPKNEEGNAQKQLGVVNKSLDQIEKILANHFNQKEDNFESPQTSKSSVTRFIVWLKEMIKTN